MYAIVQAGGHQYRVAAGDTIDVQRLSAAPGESVELRDVLVVVGDPIAVGAPFVEGAVVRATVVGDAKGSKVHVFKYKPKGRYRIKTGHRQRYTRLHIDSVES
jgi:large subunit ribosomal protein L21